jgi:hypothetical protein
MLSAFARPLALLALATATGLYAARPRSAVLIDDPILAIATSSLTTLKVTAATNEQDVRPLVGQRATNLDGTLRAAPMQRMALGGNPFENVVHAASVDRMRLDTGTYQLEEVDLSLPAVVPWGIGRTYNAHQETSGAVHRDSEGFQGKNFFQTSAPEILLYDDATSAANDLVYVYLGAEPSAPTTVEGGWSNPLYDDWHGGEGAEWTGPVHYKRTEGSPSNVTVVEDMHCGQTKTGKATETSGSLVEDVSGGQGDPKVITLEFNYSVSCPCGKGV